MTKGATKMVHWDDIRISEEDSYSQDGYAAYSIENTGTLNVTLNDNTLLTPGQERVFPYFPGFTYTGLVRLSWASGTGTKAVTLKVFRIKE